MVGRRGNACVGYFQVVDAIRVQPENQEKAMKVSERFVAEQWVVRE
jgi:hypothetical protein